YLGDRLVVDIVLAVQPFGVEVFLDREVAQAIDDALALGLGDLAEGLALHPIVLFEHRGLHHHVVPPRAADADRRPAPEFHRLISASFISAPLPPPDWMRPVPRSRSTSPRAKISFSSAQIAGMCTPCGSKWPWLRDTDRPSAPAFMPSRMRFCIWRISSSVAV